VQAANAIIAKAAGMVINCRITPVRLVPIGSKLPASIAERKQHERVAFPVPAGDLAFGYPAKDQRRLAARCRRLKSMLAPNRRRAAEAFPAPLLRPGGGPQRDLVSGDNSLSGAKAFVRGVSTQFSEGRNARKSAGLSKADQRACRHR
jgi:hypothetical protein